ncbi:MAG TPA: porin family protein [Ideonella sp.]|uniref:porin family protein n=1 Tax=Ideonella sp. TaxID=1929293 RepID=UPI002C3CE86A|nr:porin family protein [Ideonella sp.]HSI52119.1 porin family protein [Ideonella sp.]
MKKISMAIAAAATVLLSSAAMAQQAPNSRLYVNGAVGASHFDADCAGTESCDNSGTGARVMLGYELGGGLAGEVGYMSFGEAKATVGGVRAKIEAGGILLGVAFRAPFARDWDATARLGVISMKTKVSATDGVNSASDDETNTAAYAGLGLGYAVTPALHVELNVDFSRAEYTDAQADLRNFSVGLRYAF